MSSPSNSPDRAGGSEALRHNRGIRIEVFAVGGARVLIRYCGCVELVDHEGTVHVIETCPTDLLPAQQVLAEALTFYQLGLWGDDSASEARSALQDFDNRR